MPCPPPEDLSNPGIKPTSPALAGRFFTAEPRGKPSQVVMDRSMTLCDLLAEPGGTCVVANTPCWVHINPSGEVETDRRSSHEQVVVSGTPAKSGTPG